MTEYDIYNEADESKADTELGREILQTLRERFPDGFTQPQATSLFIARAGGVGGIMKRQARWARNGATNVIGDLLRERDATDTRIWIHEGHEYPPPLYTHRDDTPDSKGRRFAGYLRECGGRLVAEAERVDAWFDARGESAQKKKVS